jgi:hypothetical protein
MANNYSDLDAILWGARNIARAVNVSERTAFHLLQSGLLPGVKVGKIWSSTRRRLLARINGEDGWMPPPKPAATRAVPPQVAKSRKRKLVGERHRGEER